MSLLRRGACCKYEAQQHRDRYANWALYSHEIHRPVAAHRTFISPRSTRPEFFGPTSQSDAVRFDRRQSVRRPASRLTSIGPSAAIGRSNSSAERSRLALTESRRVLLRLEGCEVGGADIRNFTLLNSSRKCLGYIATNWRSCAHGPGNMIINVNTLVIQRPADLNNNTLHLTAIIWFNCDVDRFCWGRHVRQLMASDWWGWLNWMLALHFCNLSRHTSLYCLVLGWIGVVQIPVSHPRATEYFTDSAPLFIISSTTV